MLNRSRLLGFLLTVTAVLLLMVVGVALAALPPGGTFADDNGNVHEGNIEAIAAEGITKGCNPPANTLYCPDGTVTRGQMAAFLARAFSLPSSSADYFSDDNDSVFEGDINAVAMAGITKGCNPPANDRFCPDGKITREQMAAFLNRAFGYPSSSTDFFTDDADSIFQADINAIAQAGVTLGCNPPANDRYCPTALVKRDQMASFFARALGLKPITPPDEDDPRTLDADGDLGAGSSVAIGTDGYPIISYFDDTNNEVRIRHCEDRRCVASSVQVVANARIDGDMVIGSDGLAAVAYISSGDLYLAHCENVACSSTTTRNVTGSSGAASVLRPSAAIGADGNPMISYMDGATVMFARCFNSKCSQVSLNPIRVANLGANPDVALGADGLPAIAYYNSATYGLRFVHCLDASCVTGTIRDLDGGTFESVGQSPALAIGTDGLPFITHFVWGGPADLMGTHCLDTICSAATNRKIDSSGIVGGDSAITIGSDGNPIIAYLDSTQGALKAYDCRVPACNHVSDTGVTVDSGMVGRYPSIAVGTDGVPIVTYQDYGVGSLKVVFLIP